jgi:predicted ribosome quality control (RQC) complex YloA/Tae2 family protein
VLSLRELRRAVAALERERLGARLDRAVQVDGFELVLVLRGGGGRPARDKCHLLLSCRPGFARLSVLAKARQAPPAPPGFVSYLRAHAEGGRLEEVRIESDDRQALLRFTTAEGSLGLLLSILGPRSNLYLIDGAGILVGSQRPLDQTRRDLRGGEPWRDPETRPPGEGEDRFAETPEEQLLAAIEEHYQAAEAESRKDLRLQRIAQALKKHRGRVERKLRNLERDAGAAAEAPDLQRQGELLKSALGSLRPGADQARVKDFETGAEVSIVLDPALSPQENLQQIFKRARKAERQAHKAQQRLGEVRARLEELDALRSECDALCEGGDPRPEDLEAFAARPAVRRLIDRYFPAPPEEKPPADRKAVWKIGKTEIPPRLQPKRYRTRDGLEIWVGKSDEGNDLLTTRLARGRDLFFHLEGSPGSHVILRTEGRGDPPSESLLEAGELAVHFSKQKNATRASVHVAPIKHVSKPSGTKPGLVYVHRGRTIDLRRDPARLERILDARIDD